MNTQTQEPVAWMYEDELPDNYPYDAMFRYSAVIDGVRMFSVFAPTHPAPAWQGLSDDEIDDISICEQISPDRLWHIYVAIEQALKEKNNAL